MAMHDFNALTEHWHTIEDLGLIAERGSSGVFANVRHVIYHSPNGLDFGTDCVKSSDLALSALCALIPAPNPVDEALLERLDAEAYGIAETHDHLWSVRTPKMERISRLAWRLHQPFKMTFILSMKGKSGYVPVDIMREWIEVHSRALIERCSRDH
ncbi:hypothetical protein [Sphingomonas sp. 3-13AW]|uniref:hypothetical protein n=1 Tax=Sphingomonas sp. 3-13AW TaxID=3050450 RepID=UPI003BB56601